MKCYFASPFFNDEQIEREEALKKILRDKGIEVYSPKEECLISPNSTYEEIDSVFIENISNIQNTDFVFCVTDGKDVGTIWESGFAFAYGVPILYFCETLNGGKFNMMLAKSGKGVVTSRLELENLTIEDFLKMIMHGKMIGNFEGVLE